MDSGGEGNNGGGRGGSSTDSSEEEDQDDSSSHQVEDALASFREKWQKELKISPIHEGTVETNKNDVVAIEDCEIVARNLFLKGIDMEKSGKFYEAIQFYRRAVQLVPDIEFRLDDLYKNKPRDYQESEEIDDVEEVSENNDTSSDEDDDVIKDNLLSHIQKKINKGQYFCLPTNETTSVHISVLPMEIILYIFKWVVSSDLDLRSLEICSSVCRGFYLCARDSEIWRLACIRTWGLNCGNLNFYSSWRQMFIERARLHFNGCYISKTTYIRHGENSFQDQYYRPWHLVAYYRYLRFFPEGLVLMLTTPDEPAQCVGLMKQRTIKNQSVLEGHYRLKDDRIIIVVQRLEQQNNSLYNRRHARRDRANDKIEQTFHLELQIQNYNKKQHIQLIWHRYSVFTKYRNGNESSSNFDIVANRFPPFWFSRVKSYTTESMSPLQ